jgi:hypothetical protein
MMASEATLALRKIQPPAARLFARGTFRLQTTMRRHEKQALEPKKRSGYVPTWSMGHYEIQLIERQLIQDFRARKRAWWAGANRVIERAFRGLWAASQ